MNIRLMIAFAFLCLALGTSTSRADLAFAGGSVRQQTQIRSVFDTLPACCRTSTIIRVQLLSDHDMDSYIELGDPQASRMLNLSSIDGIYQNGLPTITLRVSDANADASAAFAHEYGHYVWQRLLLKKQRDEYDAIYKRQLRAHSLVTAYAACGVQEGFAEAYCYYVLHKDVLNARDSCSCCFLESAFGNSQSGSDR